MRHLLTLFDYSAEEIDAILETSGRLKARWEQGDRPGLLAGRVLALLFAKPSLRTRVSFEAGMVHLGGQSLYLGQDVGWGKRESTADFARVLSQFADAIVCRTYHHEEAEELARHATCPVINGLTDQFHPCQALADLYTLRELRGSVTDRPLVFVGDGNNVSRSLAVCCARLRIPFVLACPSGYEFDAPFLARLREAVPAADVSVVHDAHRAVREAIAIYTDVWSSMGQEDQQDQRRQAFATYQVNRTLMRAAPQDAIFLHCLPARRGEEVTDEVMDGSQSEVIRQAGNRMHVQKGVLVTLLGQANRGG